WVEFRDLGNALFDLLSGRDHEAQGCCAAYGKQGFVAEVVADRNACQMLKQLGAGVEGHLGSQGDSAFLNIELVNLTGQSEGVIGGVKPVPTRLAVEIGARQGAPALHGGDCLGIQPFSTRGLAALVTIGPLLLQIGLVEFLAQGLEACTQKLGARLRHEIAEIPQRGAFSPLEQRREVLVEPTLKGVMRHDRKLPIRLRVQRESGDRAHGLYHCREQATPVDTACDGHPRKNLCPLRGGTKSVCRS
ncbi:MAG: hypothetical protein IH628_03040, partial [Proteobacteria bacterium]|nr:hypothetical protein [Pseudomonadota bacterium]